MNLNDLINETDREEVEKIKQEMIAQVDIPALTEIFEYTLRNSYRSNHRSHCTSNELDKRAVCKYLEIWAENKWPIFILLGRKICYSFNTGISLDRTFFEDLRRLYTTKSIRRNRKAGDEGVVISTEQFALYRPVIELFGEFQLQTNICPENDKIKNAIKGYIPGQKLSRFFSKFFGDENFDIEYSKLFQNNVNGLIGNISIDPVDFATISYSSHYSHSCYALDSFYNSAGYSLMLGTNDIILFCSKGDKKSVRSIQSPIRDKINRFCLYIDYNLERLHFHSHIIDSSKKFVDKFVMEIEKLIKKSLQEKITYVKHGKCSIKNDIGFHHCCDAQGELFEKSGIALPEMQIDPGFYNIPKMSNVDELCDYDDRLEGWIM